MLKAKNDSQRLKDEYKQLRQENPELGSMMIKLYHWVKREFDKDVIMTMIFRTDAEQDEIYADNAKYQKRKFKSPHQFWHAVDIRSRNFTDEEIKKIEDWINENYNDSNYYKWTAKCHKVGKGAYHFHIQYVRK